MAGWHLARDASGSRGSARARVRKKPGRATQGTGDSPQPQEPPGSPPKQ